MSDTDPQPSSFPADEGEAASQTFSNTTGGEGDSVWKEILDEFFRDFMAFFFPAVNQVIDWERGYEFLDTELAQLTPTSLTGKRLADKLVKVYRLGEQAEIWLYIHIEVQGYSDKYFAERMFIYHYRIFDRFYQIKPVNQPAVKVISLAVLTDAGVKYRPEQYQVTEAGGFELTFRFPTVKLLDYNDKWDELETNPNLFAVVVMAHLKNQQERHNPAELLDWKVRLVELLYQRNYSEEQPHQMLRFIDWLMRLPEELEPIARERLARLEEGRMPYVTSFERLAKAEGREEGREEGRKEGTLDLVIRLLERRFGELEPEIVQQISNNLSIEQLDELGVALLDFQSKADVTAWLAQRAAQPPQKNSN